MGIRAKQMLSSTFTSAEVTRVFASGSVALDRLAEAVIQADGGQAFTADQPFGGFKITGLGAGVSATDGVTKAQLDSASLGLTWVDPVLVKEVVGSATIATIDGLTPTKGDAYVASDAGTPAAGTSDALVAGSITEFNGTSWLESVAGSGGFVPSGTRALASIQTALNGSIGLTDGVDDGKILDWDGTSLTPSAETSPVDGNAVLVSGEGTCFENNAFVFDGTVPTGVWVQFAGTSTANAGGGLTASGNVLSVGAGAAITVNADDVAVDPTGLIQGGAAEVDGDFLDIDFAPTNYTEATGTVGGVGSVLVDHLTAHLGGIDTALASAGNSTSNQESITTEVITGTDTAITDTLNNTPTGDVTVILYLNGIQQVQGAGADYTISSQTITWLASSGTAVDMDATDVLIAVYLS